MIEKYHQGIVHKTASDHADDKAFAALAEETLGSYRKAMDEYQINDALKAVCPILALPINTLM